MSRLMVGLMSGTSVDGIDAALVRVEGKGGGYAVEVVAHVERKWPGKLRGRLLKVMAPAEVSVGEICSLHAEVAVEFAKAAEDVMRAAGVGKEEVAAVGSHGQTVCHLPRQGKKGRGGMGSTLQLGDVSVLATLLGMRVVGNFRPADMAVGGEGAPLVPWTDDVLLSDREKVRCVQNIGGIANVTYLPRRGDGRGADGEGRGVVAFDTGAGNMVMDAVVGMGSEGRMRFDRGGRLARKGEMDWGLFRELQGHGYFERRPPKSTGREEFGEGFAKRVWASGRRRGLALEDVVHVLARWTAWSIADAYLHYLPRLPEEVIVCGGGADNPVLMEMLGEELGRLGTGIVVRRIEEFGIANKAKEAVSFALLAAATLDGVAGNLPAVTGARRGVVLGVVGGGRVRTEG